MRSHPAQPAASKGSYSQVGFSYDGEGKEESRILESDDEDEDLNSDDSNDEGMDAIAREFGLKRYSWLVHMDKRAKEEAKRQKERKLSRKERRKASQMEREREREVARITGSRAFHHDPYREPRRSPTYESYSRSRRSRSGSRSHSPYSRRYDHGMHSDTGHRSKSRTTKIEYIY